MRNLKHTTFEHQKYRMCTQTHGEHLRGTSSTELEILPERHKQIRRDPRWDDFPRADLTTSALFRRNETQQHTA